MGSVNRKAAKSYSLSSLAALNGSSGIKIFDMQEENLKEMLEQFKWTNPKATKALQTMFYGYLLNCEQNNQNLSQDVIFFAQHMEEFLEKSGVS